MRFRRSSPPAILSLAVMACGHVADVDDEPRFDLLQALVDHGASVQYVDAADNGVLDVTAQVLRVDGHTLWAFEHRDSRAASLAASGFSPDGTKYLGPGAVSFIGWVDDPHLFLRERWVVAYAGSDPAILGLLVDVMGQQFAGARP